MSTLFFARLLLESRSIESEQHPDQLNQTTEDWIGLNSGALEIVLAEHTIKVESEQTNKEGTCHTHTYLRTTTNFNGMSNTSVEEPNRVFQLMYCYVPGMTN